MEVLELDFTDRRTRFNVIQVTLTQYSRASTMSGVYYSVIPVLISLLPHYTILLFVCISIFLASKLSPRHIDHDIRYLLCIPNISDDPRIVSIRVCSAPFRPQKHN
jgi:hypothetical protein